MPSFHATRVPTLLIGIGGIGGQIVRGVQKSLRDYDLQFVKMLCLDTDTNALDGVISQNIPTIQTSENQTVSDYLQQHKSYGIWFPTNPLINSKNLTQGAGQIRSVSRLGALASEEAHRFDDIANAIDEIKRNTGDTLHNKLRVMIVGSICGGTGSGLGIQLPFLIREIEPDILIRGLFITPELVEELQDTNEKKSSVYVNGYAFLRELNAFYNAQTSEEAAQKLKVEHYHTTYKKEDISSKSNPVPYDFLFLVEKSDREGQNIGNIDDYIAKSIEVVRSQLFSATITSSAYSTEDNLIIGLVKTDGRRRYCGAGISKAIYPEEENLRYCTLRYSESVLKKHWLQIDRMVDKRLAQHTKQMAVNHSLKPLDAQKEYRNIFDELTDPTKHTEDISFGLLARELKSEVSVTDSMGNTNVVQIDHAKRLVDAIKSFPERELLTEDFESESQSCLMSLHELNNPEHAPGHVTSQLNNLRRFERTTKEKVGQLTAACIEAICPSDLESAANYSDSSKNLYCIYNVLKTTNPIVTRYILYYLKEQLASIAEKCKAKIVQLDNQETIFTKDYYVERNDNTIENPQQALAKTKPGILSFAAINSPQYNRLIKSIHSDTLDYISRIKEYYLASLTANICEGVLKKLEILISQYEKFFRELEEILRIRKEERTALENKDERIRKSNLYICCDPICKQWMYSEFEKQISSKDNSLSDDIKLSFFETMYDEFAKKLQQENGTSDSFARELSMKELFEKSILNPMVEKFDKVEFQHIHMDVLQAITKEYQILATKGMLMVNNQPVNYEDITENEYFISIAKQLRELSRPNLSYEATGEGEIGKVLVFWGVNHDAVLKYQQNDDIDKGAFLAMFGNPNGATYNAVDDDSYSPLELICYSSIYDFSIENLNKFKSDKKPYIEYKKRLDTVCRGTFNVGTGAYDYLKTVHPHLDKNWHKHAYLPMLRIDEEEQAQKDIKTAFLLAVARRYCRYLESDETKRWAFKPIDGRFYETLELNNVPSVRASFYSLYLTIDENPIVVEDILSMNNDEIDSAYNSARMFGADLKTILSQLVIKGFIGKEIADTDEIVISCDSNDKLPYNIIDVLYSVYNDSFDRELVADLVYTLSEYIFEYCKKMTNDQPGLSKKLAKEIALAIGKNSKAKTNEEFHDLCSDFFED